MDDNKSRQEMTKEDLDYIDAVVTGMDTFEAYTSYIKYDEDMDTDQLAQVAKEYSRRMAGQVGARRLKLRQAGLLDDVERTKCTERELKFVHEYLMLSGDKEPVKEAFRAVYSTEGLTEFGVYCHAMKIFNRKSVQTAIEHYRSMMEKEFEYSLGEYIRELNENREEARQAGQIAAMNAATLEKGKVFGYSEKNKLGSENNPLTIKEKTIEEIINEFTADKDKNTESVETEDKK